MKYVQEIESLIKNIKILSLKKIALKKEFDEREEASETRLKIYAFWVGVGLFIFGYIFLKLGIGKTLAIIFGFIGLAIPLQMFARWYKEKSNKVDGYLLTKDLKRHMIFMDQDIASEENELIEKLTNHVNRVSNLVNKHQKYPSKILSSYIHCQYFQISELFCGLEMCYALKTNRAIPFDYVNLKLSFRSFKSYFAQAFYPKLKLIEIK